MLPAMKPLALAFLSALALSCSWGARAPAVITTAASPEPSASPVAVRSPAPTPSADAPSQPSLGKLAYVQDGDIWVKDLPAGEARRLTHDGSNWRPRWSPSGEWLAWAMQLSVWMAAVVER